MERQIQAERERAEQEQQELLSELETLRSDMENPKALSIHRAGEVHGLMDRVEELTEIKEMATDDDQKREAEYQIGGLTEKILHTVNDILAYLKGDVIRLTPSEIVTYQKVRRSPSALFPSSSHVALLLLLLLPSFPPLLMSLFFFYLLPSFPLPLLPPSSSLSLSLAARVSLVALSASMVIAARPMPDYRQVQERQGVREHVQTGPSLL